LEKYLSLKKVLENAIKTGEYKPGDRLPSEIELMERYCFSKNTIDRAMNLLVQERVIRRERGRGSFVNEEQAPAALRIGLIEKGVGHTGSVPENSFSQTREAFNLRGIPNALPKSERVSESKLRADSPDLDAHDIVETQFYDSLAHFIKLGKSVPLNQSMAEIGVDIFESMDPELLRFSSTNGVLHGLPLFRFPIVLLYNKKVFDSLGLPYPDGNLNWESFLKLNRTITAEKDVRGLPRTIAFGTAFTMNRLLPFIWQNGGDLLAGEGSEGHLRAKEAMEYFLELTGINQSHSAIDVKDFNYNHYLTYLFAQGKLAMMGGQAYDLQELESQGVEVGVTHLPAGKVRSTLILTRDYAATSGANAAQAARFLAGTCLPEVQTWIAGNTRLAPPSKKFLIPKAKGDATSVLLESLNEGFYLPKELASQRAFGAVSQEMNQILLFGKNIGKALLEGRKKVLELAGLD